VIALRKADKEVKSEKESKTETKNRSEENAVESKPIHETK
jgi:hypothetical protein